MISSTRALLAAALLTSAALVQASFAAPSAPAARSCTDCHKKTTAGKVVHSAVSMGCESCHAEPHAKKVPQLSLIKPVPELCFMCHDAAPFRLPVVHDPVASGGCTLCHDPHSANNTTLLLEPYPYLCERCHKDKSDGKHVLGEGYSLGRSHPVRGKKDPSWKGRELTCRSCHEPHASRWAKLSPDMNNGIRCLNCHRRVTVRP